VSNPCLPAGTDATKWPLIDAIVQQVDVKTGLVEWEWHALGHVPTADTLVPPSSFAFDPYHINSVQALPADKVLISLRDTSAIYKIDKSTGAIDWTLGGKESTFQIEAAASFHFQHDAQLTPGGRTIRLFDDASGPPVFAPGYSRGLELHLDVADKTATLQGEYVRSTDTIANSEGSVQRLSDGDRFVGFGSTAFFSQFGRDGDLKFDAALPVDDGSYRALRFAWSATPDTRPDVAARIQSQGDVAVYASWNGSTLVKRWRVIAGESADALSPVTSAPRTGFETRIAVQTSAKVFAVQALDDGERVLATSPPVPAS
jgi:hypothetical protein